MGVKGTSDKTSEIIFLKKTTNPTELNEATWQTADTCRRLIRHLQFCCLTCWKWRDKAWGNVTWDRKICEDKPHRLLGLELKSQQKEIFGSNKCVPLETTIKGILVTEHVYENSLQYQTSQVPILSGVIMLLSVPGTVLDNEIAFAFREVTFSYHAFNCQA